MGPSNKPSAGRFRGLARFLQVLGFVVLPEIQLKSGTTLIKAKSFVYLSVALTVVAALVLAVQLGSGVVSLRDGLSPIHHQVNTESATVPRPLVRPAESGGAAAKAVGAMAFGAGGALQATTDSRGNVVVSSADGIELLNVATHHQLPVTTVVFSPDGKQLYGGGADSEILAWSVESGEERLRMHGHEQPVSAIAISSDGALLASAGQETRVMLWDAATGQLRSVLSGHADFVNDIAFGPGSTELATAGADGRVLLWDTASGTIKRTLVGHTASVSKIAFASDGRTLVSGAADGSVIVWDLERGVEKLRPTGHRNDVTAVAMSADGERVATASADNQVVIWDPASGDRVDGFSGPARRVSALYFDSSGQLRVGSSNGMVN